MALPSTVHKKYPATVLNSRNLLGIGTAVLALFIFVGLFFGSACSRLPQLAAVPAQVALVEATSTPTQLPTAVPSHTPTPTASHTLTATATQTSTPLPPTITASATNTPTTEPTQTPEIVVEQTVQPAPSAWPTTDPAWLVKPPTELDLSQSHLWFSRPVDGNNNPSALYRFGMTYNQRLSPHRGVDIANDTGTPLVAVGSGTVYFAGEDIVTLFGPKPDFYGRVVVVEMAEQWEGHTIYTLYGHLDSVSVAAGQPVNSGDVVGLVGSSGVALGPHLHFEVRQDDPHSYESVRNPELWYWPYAGRGVLAGRLLDANGFFLPGSRVNLDCSDGTPRYVETYWDQYTIPDDILAENFVISDLPAGYCRVWAETPDGLAEQSIEILPGVLSGVVLQVRP